MGKEEHRISLSRTELEMLEKKAALLDALIVKHDVNVTRDQRQGNRLLEVHELHISQSALEEVSRLSSKRKYRADQYAHLSDDMLNFTPREEYFVTVVPDQPQRT